MLVDQFTNSQLRLGRRSIQGANCLGRCGPRHTGRGANQDRPAKEALRGDILQVLELLVVGPLVLQRPEESFHRRVVVAVACAAH